MKVGDLMLIKVLNDRFSPRGYLYIPINLNDNSRYDQPLRGSARIGGSNGFQSIIARFIYVCYIADRSFCHDRIQYEVRSKHTT